MSNMSTKNPNHAPRMARFARGSRLSCCPLAAVAIQLTPPFEYLTAARVRPLAYPLSPLIYLYFATYIPIRRLVSALTERQISSVQQPCSELVLCVPRRKAFSDFGRARAGFLTGLLLFVINLLRVDTWAVSWTQLPEGK